MRTALILTLLSASISIPAFAADQTEQVAGWTLSDAGGKAGDDTDREVILKRGVPGIDIEYRPGTGTGGSVVVKLAGCDKTYTFSSGFQFEDKVERIKTLRDEIDEGFSDFAKTCPFKDGADKTIMEGFDTAFGAIDKWIADRPFVYPPDAPAPASDDRNADVPGSTI